MSDDTGDGPHVRRLTAGDVVAYRIVRLELLRLASAAFGSTHADWVRLPDSAFLTRIEGGAVFGAFTARGLEGLLSVDREKGSRADHRASIHQVYVRAHLRGTGVAQALLSAGIGWARSAGLSQLELMVAADNPAARALYVRAGFRHCGVWPRALRTDDAGFIDEVLMILDLDGPSTSPDPSLPAD